MAVLWSEMHLYCMEFLAELVGPLGAHDTLCPRDGCRSRGSLTPGHAESCLFPVYPGGMCRRALLPACERLCSHRTKAVKTFLEGRRLCPRCSAVAREASAWPHWAEGESVGVLSASP